MDINLPAEVGKNLRRIRERKRLRQQDVADLMGSDKSYVCNVEAGRKDIQLSTIKAFCAALGIAPATLFRTKDEEEPESPKAAKPVPRAKSSPKADPKASPRRRPKKATAV